MDSIFIDNKHCVDVLYLDLAKAFDTVVLAKLLCKLKRMGIGGNLLKWLTSFLIGRTQQVKVKNATTQPSSVMSGIPQGTILEPFLFNYSKLYSIVDDYNDASNLSEDLRNIEHFFAEWQLNLNQDKCEVHHLGVTNQRHDYMINNQIVAKKQRTKFKL